MEGMVDSLLHTSKTLEGLEGLEGLGGLGGFEGFEAWRIGGLELFSHARASGTSAD